MKKTIALCMFVLSALALIAESQELPHVRNGRIVPVPRETSLEQWLAGTRGGGEEWVGYSVAKVAEGHRHGCGGVAYLDSDRSLEWGEFNEDTRPEDTLLVFLRGRDGRVADVRSFSARCEIDLGGRSVAFWRDFPESQSIASLSSLLTPDTPEKVARRALHAIALHAADAAYAVLLARASDESDRFRIRKQAIFWMGAARADRALPDLVRMLRDEEEERVAKQLVFALHTADSERGLEALIEAARRHDNAEVREQALFWLSQTAGDRAAEAIASAAANDPDLEVKEKAVFALSQLPRDEGVPLLLEVAENHPQPEVRKKAFFWLGQSGDERAIDFIERVLLSRR